MNAVEMQPSVLPTSFSVPDTRSIQPAAYLEQAHHIPPYADSRQSSKENRSPPASTASTHLSASSSPQSARGHDQQPVTGQASPQSVAGKKRTANGEVKAIPAEAPKLTSSGHSRATSNVTMMDADNKVSRPHTDVGQISQQLRTRLTYAMVKVQNGWQNRSLDEVESLASASPRSTTFNHYSDNNRLLSPRVALSAHLQRQDSNSSSGSDKSQQQQVRGQAALMSPPSSKKGLAPPANIVSRQVQQRRRRTPNMQVNTAPPQLSARPPIKHRTPSQTAGMEADAVETLLFMASPNNSGHQSSQFSPVTSAPSVNHFPSQTSPLRNTFSAPTSPKRVAFAASGGYAARYGRDKGSIIASMVERLDEDDDAELDEALRVIDQHHAAKVTT